MANIFNNIKWVIKDKLPSLHRFIIYNIYFNGAYYKLHHYFLIRGISKRKKVKVVFFASSLGMWRYQKLYDLLSKDYRFDCHIVIHPFCTYSFENQKHDAAILRDYFNNNNSIYHDAFESKGQTLNWIKEFDPDMLFYPQPYTGIYNDEFECKNFAKKLLCYHPYGIVTLRSKGLYNEFYQNVAWKVFYTTKYHLRESQEFMSNGGRNVEIVGDLNCDFRNHVFNSDIWKKQTIKKKRIIWAPHFTISGNSLLHRASFLWLADFMLEIAKRYKDSIQLSFKPHPRLKTELYQHKDWGKERTDNYYKSWETNENTQLNEGEYIDLFLTSDAMIHDSGSFSAEYLYTKKPIAFTAQDSSQIYCNLNEFGVKCIDLHYILHNILEVEMFIQDLLNDIDSKKTDREIFYDEVLQSPNGKSVAQNIYESILEGLHILNNEQ